ncbi:MAG: hypothetical protein K5770_14045 [Lachnospiraceae bacterium]|nr:hypothetical protein [Lachnospiraceae bacterium]
MDVNGIIKGLEQVTGLEVVQDIYEGKKKQYIVFSYQDERPALMGDDMVIFDRCDIYVHLYTEPQYDYHAMKHAIRDYLEGHGFYVTIQSWIEDLDEQSVKKIRDTTFDCEYSDFRNTLSI